MSADGTVIEAAASGLKMAGQHSADSAEWYSPPRIVEASRHWMGGIDLDPASSALANQNVRAGVYYTEEQDGLSRPWFGRWFDNPPTPPRLWWEKATASIISREAEQGVFIAYSIEALSQSQGWKGPPMSAFSVCIPKGRVRYCCTARDALAKVCKLIAKRPKIENLWVEGLENLTKEEKKKRAKMRALHRRRDKLAAMDPDRLVEGDAPPHASAIIGLGGDHESFAEAFGAIGACLRGTGRGTR